MEPTKSCSHRIPRRTPRDPVSRFQLKDWAVIPVSPFPGERDLSGPHYRPFPKTRAIPPAQLTLFNGFIQNVDLDAALGNRHQPTAVRRCRNPHLLLIIDNDILCKLGAAHLFLDAVASLGAYYDQCRRIPALPHMLRRGSLRDLLGPDLARCLVPLANSIDSITGPSTDWLSPLTNVPDIDPGEAMLFAATAKTTGSGA